MKLTLSYKDEEATEAALLSRVVHAQYPGTKSKESCKHPPNKHIYFYIPVAPQNPKRLGLPAAGALDGSDNP